MFEDLRAHVVMYMAMVATDEWHLHRDPEARIHADIERRDEIVVEGAHLAVVIGNLADRNIRAAGARLVLIEVFEP